MRSTLDVVNNEKSMIEETVFKSKATKEQFLVISTSIEDIIEQIIEITKSTQQQSDIATDMAKAIETLTVSTQDNAEAVQSITEKTDIQSEIVAKVESGNHEIKLLVKKLDDITGKFKV